METSCVPVSFPGLVGSTATGGGFDSLHFVMTREGIAVVDQTFADLGSANTYFGDHTVDFGAIGSNLTGLLDIGLELKVTAHGGDGFTANLLIANATPASGVPEPSCLAVGTMAFAGLARRQRRERKSEIRRR